MNLKFSKNNRLIAYNNIGLVDSIMFSNGANVAYTYAMNGEKLKVVHRAASRSMASAEILAAGDFSIVPMPIVNTSVREYILGNIEKDYEETVIGNTYRYYFGNGYVKFSDGFAALNPQYFFYTKDHLGNVRSVVTKNHSTNEITEVQQTHYYPFGGIIADLGTGRSVQNHLYNGKELDTSNNLYWYDYGARQYDPTAPRFTTPDKYSEKYYSQNMFGYCGNNPINRIDINGDSISVDYLQQFDNTNHTDYLQKIINDLQFETGLTLSTSNEGILEYAKDSSGQPIIKLDENGKATGSQSARNFMIKMMDGNGTVSFAGGKRTAALAGTNIIGINPKQIENLIEGTSKRLDSRTLGWGMTIMHELNHTLLGGSYKDDMSSVFSTGPVVDFMNNIRAELNAQGYNFGRRMQYLAIPIGNFSILHFDKLQYILIK